MGGGGTLGTAAALGANVPPNNVPPTPAGLVSCVVGGTHVSCVVGGCWPGEASWLVSLDAPLPSLVELAAPLAAPGDASDARETWETRGTKKTCSVSTALDTLPQSSMPRERYLHDAPQPKSFRARLPPLLPTTPRAFQRTRRASTRGYGPVTAAVPLTSGDESHCRS